MLETWGLDIWEGAGQTLDMVASGNASEEYLALPVCWDASFAHYEHTPVVEVWAKSRDHRRLLAMHVRFREYQVAVLPQALSPEGLSWLAHGWVRWCKHLDATRIRSPQEQQARQRLTEVERSLDALQAEAAELRRAIDTDMAATSVGLQDDPDMVLILACYTAGLSNRDLGQFTLALEHLKRVYKTQRMLMDTLHITKREYASITQVAQDGPRHVVKGDPSRRGPTDEQWQRAVFVMRGILEKHWAYICGGSDHGD